MYIQPIQHSTVYVSYFDRCQCHTIPKTRTTTQPSYNAHLTGQRTVQYGSYKAYWYPKSAQSKTG